MTLYNNCLPFTLFSDCSVIIHFRSSALCLSRLISNAESYLSSSMLNCSNFSSMMYPSGVCSFTSYVHIISKNKLIIRVSELDLPSYSPQGQGVRYNISLYSHPLDRWLALEWSDSSLSFQLHLLPNRTQQDSRYRSDYLPMFHSEHLEETWTLVYPKV